MDDRLDTHRLLDRATDMLMVRDGLSKSEAFDFIKRTAMDRHALVTDVLTEIIDGITTP